MKTEIRIDIQAQPDDETCGPTCLHSLYRYYGLDVPPLKQVIHEIHRLDNGGTLAEILGLHALKKGFGVTIYTYHLRMFDPTWFADDGLAHDAADLSLKLEKQSRHKRGDRRFRVSTRAFREYLARGGQVRMQTLTPALIRQHLAEGVPIIAGLSSTYLYRTARQRPGVGNDDIRGDAEGHFVMLVGYDSTSREVLVADPLDPNPPFHTAKYRLDVDRLVNAILLGALTYDANLLVIRPKASRSTPRKAKTKARRSKPRK
jgi:hypothetical protein